MGQTVPCCCRDESSSGPATFLSSDIQESAFPASTSNTSRNESSTSTPQRSTAQPAPSSNGVPTLTGKRRALLIGINYTGTKAQLKGCINDVNNISTLLTDTFEWNAEDIKRLTDDGQSQETPTKQGIQDAVRWLVDDAKPGDVLFFHFSGHGAQKVDPHGYQEDGMNETICPVDFERVGMITDDELSAAMIFNLPEGVRLTAVMDCCHSGTGLDLPFKLRSAQWKEETNPYHCLCDAQLFSGCEEGKTSADAQKAYSAPAGAMTSAFCDVLREQKDLTYPVLMDGLNNKLRERGFKQKSLLTATQKFGLERMFSLCDIVANTNALIGRTVRKKFSAQPKKYSSGDPLYAMLVASGLAVATSATNSKSNDNKKTSGSGKQGGSSGNKSKQSSSSSATSALTLLTSLAGLVTGSSSDNGQSSSNGDSASTQASATAPSAQGSVSSTTGASSLSVLGSSLEQTGGQRQQTSAVVSQGAQPQQHAVRAGLQHSGGRGSAASASRASTARGGGRGHRR